MTDSSPKSQTWYTGPIYRGVDYSPTWPKWVVGTGATQTADSDFANDAFQSFWSDKYRSAPSGDAGKPHDNGSNYRDDLKTIRDDGFNLVRLYNWDMARGSSSVSGPALGHINFLDYADELGLKIVVPVSDYFLGDNQYAWNGQTPSSSYSFSSAPTGIQNDFNLFVSSITDPKTNKIHNAIHSISVGNEGDIGQGISGTTASHFLARTIWWIYNLHGQINGSGTAGPNGNPVVNGTSPVILLSATFSDADQGGENGLSWFKYLIDGAAKDDSTPNGCALGETFDAKVTGLSSADSKYSSYYYNSVNISQVTMTSPYPNSLASTLADYDSGNASWPGAKLDVPLLLMEVFTENRTRFNKPTDQAEAAVNQVKALEGYLEQKRGGTPVSATNFMGYNYFEFNDEQTVKLTGLYQYSSTKTDAKTGTTSIWYSPHSFPSMKFPVHPLTPTPGPSGSDRSLAGAIRSFFPPLVPVTIVNLQGSKGAWEAVILSSQPLPSTVKAGQYAIAPQLPAGTTVHSVQGPPAPVAMTAVLICDSASGTNPFPPEQTTLSVSFLG